MIYTVTGLFTVLSLKVQNDYMYLLRECLIGVGGWVVGHGSKVVGRGSWVQGSWSWVVGNWSWVVGP